MFTMPNNKVQTRKRQGAIRQKRIETQDVDTAFEMLLDAIDAMKKNLQREIAQAANDQRFDESERLSQIAREVGEFRKRVEALHDDWTAIFSNRSNGQREPAPRQKGRKKKKLEPGQYTPMKAYSRPILEALEQLGGSADADSLLKRVKTNMHARFSKYDLETLPSKRPRWMSMFWRCRHELQKEGLIKRDSQTGIWEITDQGRRWLEQNRESDTL